MSASRELLAENDRGFQSLVPKTQTATSSREALKHYMQDTRNATDGAEEQPVAYAPAVKVAVIGLMNNVQQAIMPVNESGSLRLCCCAVCFLLAGVGLCCHSGRL